MYRIALVEDMPRALFALKQELMATEKTTIVFTAENGQEFLEQMKSLPVSLRPQVVLMDIDMPVMNGIEAVRRSCVLYPEVHFIMLTVSDDDDKLFNAINAGARGYLLKEERAARIIEAIRDVLDRQGAPMSPSIARKILKLLQRQEEKPLNHEPIPAALTERETGILQGIVDGLDHKELATKLGISPNTVRNHIANVYDKLHVTTRSQAVKIAVTNKWF